MSSAADSTCWREKPPTSLATEDLLQENKSKVLIASHSYLYFDWKHILLHFSGSFTTCQTQWLCKSARLCLEVWTSIDLSRDFSCGATEKSPLALLCCLVSILCVSCQCVCQCCSWVLSALLCCICFHFFLFFFIAFCLTSHHVKTQPTTDLSLFIDFIIVGLILYSSILTAEQHKVLFVFWGLRSRASCCVFRVLLIDILVRLSCDQFAAFSHVASSAGCQTSILIWYWLKCVCGSSKTVKYCLFRWRSRWNCSVVFLLFQKNNIIL